MSEKSGYVGKIKNSGSQKVDAPNQSKNKGVGKVITGKDLRTGNKK